LEVKPTGKTPFPTLDWLPEDDAYQTFLEDEFSFEIQLVTKGQKRLRFAEATCLG
jgi:hypothetical protein